MIVSVGRAIPCFDATGLADALDDGAFASGTELLNGLIDQADQAFVCPG